MFSGIKSASARQHVVKTAIAILRFPKWRLPPSWIFRNSNFYRLIRLRYPICESLPNFIKIHQSVAEIWRIFDFSRWRPFVILDLLLGYLNRPRRVLGGLYHCAKNCWNRCTGFDNMQVLWFCALGLKTPIHAPKIGVLGAFDPLNGHR